MDMTEFNGNHPHTYDMTLFMALLKIVKIMIPLLFMNCRCLTPVQCFVPGISPLFSLMAGMFALQWQICVGCMLYLHAVTLIMNGWAFALPTIFLLSAIDKNTFIEASIEYKTSLLSCKILLADKCRRDS